MIVNQCNTSELKCIKKASFPSIAIYMYNKSRLSSQSVHRITLQTVYHIITIDRIFLYERNVLCWYTGYTAHQLICQIRFLGVSQHELVAITHNQPATRHHCTRDKG